MRLRTILLAIVALAVAASLYWLTQDSGAIGPVIMLAIVGIGLAIERQLYGAPRAAPPGPGWQATGERFFDDATGRMVDVWFHPASGERRYQDAGPR